MSGLARAAGINEKAALRIAEAAQFVDDYTEEEDLETSDSALVSYWPTGHGLTCDKNFDPMKLDAADPHRVWVPFHFIPGNEGNTYKERMKCRKDSIIAQHSINWVLLKSNKPYFLELAGIMAHIYADTFSHYGFIGLHSEENMVDANNIKLEALDQNIERYIIGKAKGFFDRIGGFAASTATRGLGHASVADFPDRPYLRWSFIYENGEHSKRDNQGTFLEACEKLFHFFTRIKTVCPQYAEVEAEQSFETIRSEIKDILAYEANKEDRAARWQVSARSGKLSFIGEIPDYCEHMLEAELLSVKDVISSEVVSKRVWLFTRAAELMRSNIIYELLPEQCTIG